tara:strand:- start:933 stop:1115 length:183 start_codon:yes stop_codon:yes gene_type:complete
MKLTSWDILETLRVIGELRDSRLISKQTYDHMLNGMGVSFDGVTFSFMNSVGSVVEFKKR